MSTGSVRVEEKSYEMPPKEGLSIAHFITVTDIQRSCDYYEKVFGATVLSRGAEFITEPIVKYGETRCYIRDPDGYIIEVGQSKDGVKYG